MTEAEIRALMMKTITDLIQLIQERSQEIEQLLDAGESELAQTKITAFRERIELEILRTENKILKDGNGDMQ